MSQETLEDLDSNEHENETLLTGSSGSQDNIRAIEDSDENDAGTSMGNLISPQHSHAPLLKPSEKQILRDKTVEMEPMEDSDEDRRTRARAAGKGVPTDEGTFQIRYTYLMWFLIIFSTFITVFDRFTWNVWPLWVTSPGPWRDNWAITSFVSWSWISGRMMLVSTSVMFLMQCRVFWNWVVENCPKWLYIDGIMEDNNAIHWHSGWALVGLPVCLHVWSIFMPGAAFGADMKIYWSWTRPEDPDTGKRVEFYDDGLLSLSVNDIYRLISTSIAFFMCIPLTMAPLCRNWSFNSAMNLHLIAAASYTIDLIRMYSHPHCWFVNCPFIGWYLWDRLYGVFKYRKCEAVVVRKEIVDESNMILFLKLPEEAKQESFIGDLYYLNVLGWTWTRAHPFTTFANHSGTLGLPRTPTVTDRSSVMHKFRFQKSVGDLGEEELEMIRRNTESFSHISNFDSSETDWDVGVMAHIYDENSAVLDQLPWTMRIAQQDAQTCEHLQCWGPYRSSYRHLIRQMHMGKEMPPLVLVGSGTGCAYLIDFHQYMQKKNIKLHSHVEVYATVRSQGLYQYVTDAICERRVPNFTVNAHLTSNDHVSYTPRREKCRDGAIGRASFEEILENCPLDAHVYFCGSAVLQGKVGKICGRRGLEFHAGHTFGA